MAIFGYLFVLLGFYFFGIALLKYRGERHTQAVGHTFGGLAFIVVGTAKLYGIERNPSIVVAFLFFATIAMFAYVSASR